MTFYALFKTTKVGMGEDGDGMPVETWTTEMHAITAAQAANLRGALRVDVSGLGYEPQTADGPNTIVMSGPKPPIEDPINNSYEFGDPNASGVYLVMGQSNVGYPWLSLYEEINIGIFFDDWPAESPRGAFIVEYEAAGELVYANKEFFGNPHMFMWATADETRIVMSSRTEAGLGVYSFKIYTLGDGAPATADRLLLRLTIAPESDGSLLESYEAHPLLSDWVASWPELETYPGNHSPLTFMFEPFANASFFMPITIEMITFPPEGPAPGATLDDFLYLEADMFPGFDRLSRDNYGIDESGGSASYYTSLPAWEFSPDPRVMRSTVREIRIYSVGGGAEPVLPFWVDLMGTTETL